MAGHLAKVAGAVAADGHVVGVARLLLKHGLVEELYVGLVDRSEVVPAALVVAVVQAQGVASAAGAEGVWRLDTPELPGCNYN